MPLKFFIVLGILLGALVGRILYVLWETWRENRVRKWLRHHGPQSPFLK